MKRLTDLIGSVFGYDNVGVAGELFFRLFVQKLRAACEIAPKLHARQFPVQLRCFSGARCQMDTQLLAGLLIFRIALHPQIHLVFHHPRRKRRRDADALLDLRFLAQNVGVLDIEKHRNFHARRRVKLVDHQISHPCRRFPVDAVHRVFFPVIADT